MSACGISKEDCKACGDQAVTDYTNNQLPTKIAEAKAAWDKNEKQPLLDKLASFPHDPTEQELREFVGVWNVTPPTNDIVDFLNYSTSLGIKVHESLIDVENNPNRWVVASFNVDGKWIYFYISSENKMVETKPTVGKIWDDYPHVKGVVIGLKTIQ